MKKLIENILKQFVRKMMAIFPETSGRLIKYAVKVKHGTTVLHEDPQSREIFEMVAALDQEMALFVTLSEAYALAMCVRRTEKVAGDIAEVGVFRGGTARLICEMKNDRNLHLFDTFSGIPHVCELDRDFAVGNFSAVSLEGVKALLSRYPNVNFHKGIFPATAEAVKDKRFSLVHLDVDVYASTLSCLEFFYPRMNLGGVILSHDYMRHKGVKVAIDEFFKGKPEIILEMADCQGLIVKT